MPIRSFRSSQDRSNEQLLDGTLSVLTPAINGSYTGVFDDRNRVGLGIVLTLLLLLLYSHHFWYVKVPLSVIAIAGFILPHWRISRWLWGLALVIIAIGSYTNWYSIDNHKYLLGYWCLAIFLSLFSSRPERVLADSARWMIGLVFLVAVLQKSTSDDYLDGTFFYYELLLDGRFSGLATYLGGIPEHFKDLNEAARRALVNFDSGLTSVHLQGTEATKRVATFITWWNYLIQLVIGFAFLLPGSNWLTRTRNAWLLLFLLTTYLFAPVIGFGWVLAIMGIVQTEDGQQRTRALYVTAFLFLQIYRIPWGEALSALADLATG